jgi:RHS repeat-associated protein
VVWEAEYRPFGEVVIVTEAVENNLRFAGQYFDRESNLHYNLFRFYNTQTGRYLRADPLGVTVFDLDSKQFGLNHLYVYVENNPLIRIDPNGLFAIPPSSLSVPPTPPGDGDSSGAKVCLGPNAGNDQGCAQEISDCKRLCQTARIDPDMPNIWGGSWAQCMLGCVSWRCMDSL